MSSLNIAISGLMVAQRGLENVGTNIANASSEGYHKQNLKIVPDDLGSGVATCQGGSKVAGVVRSLDVLLESQLLSQQPLSGQVSQELTSLQMIESSFGSSDSGLAAQMATFFNSLRQASVQPTSSAYQEQLVRDAQGLTTQFRTLSSYLTNLSDQITLEAKDIVNQVNSLTSQIHDLNGQIQMASVSDGATNALADRRDQAISDLSKLVSVQTRMQDDGVVTVDIAGIPAVTFAESIPVTVDVTDSKSLRILINHSELNGADCSGRLGALLTVKNDTISGLHDTIDTLANELISRVNQLHVQGVGSSGPFTELTGQKVATGKLSTWDAPVSAGTFYVRVTKTSTGEVTRTAVTIDPAVDTAATLATKLAAVAHVSASVADSRLHLQADNGYTFDFLPGVLSTPTSSTLTGTSLPTISGLYTGETNQAYSFKVTSGGQVGIDANVAVEVRNGAGELVKTLNLGAGYAAGTALDVANGIQVSLGAGTLTTDETFTAQALASSDPTGVLAAAGLNTFFAGRDASDIAVADEVAADPGRFAFARGSEMTDNANILRMVELESRKLPALGNITLADSFTQMVTSVGQQVQVATARQSSLDSVVEQLQNRRDQVSGVDINEETTNLMSYEKSFQAMARFLDTVNTTLGYLMNLVGR